jgi:3-mercaptopyruvate sulfurtransferase SseA
MLAILVLLTVTLVAAGVVFVVQQRAAPQPLATAIPGSTEDIPRIAVDTLRGQLATSSPPLVWDMRPAAAFAEGHIPGSRPMTFDALPDATASLDRRHAIVTLCA